jgi:hypothetical protein
MSRHKLFRHSGLKSYENALFGNDANTFRKKNGKGKNLIRKGCNGLPFTPSMFCHNHELSLISNEKVLRVKCFRAALNRILELIFLRLSFM